MRCLLIIWIAYMLALTSLYCSDVANSCNDGLSKIEVLQTHDHNQDNDDTCSPFCYCSCCSVITTTFDFISFQIKKPKVAFFNKKLLLGDFDVVSNYYGNIWNPPKILV
ncbi:DUF6660 family protein [Pedobacter sp. UBA4863]|uniref:DUF6660 family protein n=1 Tax=Pedobacter sp. UBA4863 TaxID=1947060 RepID=UPI0025DEFA88|nr:DUF6660 family protein [Pedobacter sp. UBA4863]